MSFNRSVEETGTRAKSAVEEVRMLEGAKAAVEEVRRLGRDVRENAGLNLAFREEARMMRHDAVGDEDLLSGILRVDDGVASQALSSLGVTYGAVRERAEKLRSDVPVGFPPGTGPGHVREALGSRSSEERRMPFSPAAERALGRSIEEARRVGDYPRVGAEHVLLGILRNTSGTAARVLVALGAPVDVVEDRLDQFMGRTPSG